MKISCYIFLLECTIFVCTSEAVCRCPSNMCKQSKEHYASHILEAYKNNKNLITILIDCTNWLNVKAL